MKTSKYHKLQTILLKAKKDLYTHLHGGNLSRILAQGYDFAELREYHSSDDIRHISWINSAKLGQLYVKKMHEERELNVAVCTLIDGRFMVGKKLEVLTHILATLGYSAYEANETFFSIVMCGSKVKCSPPTKNIEQIEQSIDDVYRLKLLNTIVDYGKVESELLSKVEAKSLLFIIGDFLEPIDMAILAQKHEVIVIIIRDEFEENPTPLPNTQLIDPRTTQTLNQTLSKRAIKHYKKRLAEHDKRLIEYLYAHNIRFVKIYGEEEVLQKLESLQ